MKNAPNPPARSAEVDDYIAALTSQQQEAITQVRERIHATVDGLGEKISYKIPGVTIDGKVVLFFAAWKTHIGMYPIPVFDDPLEARVKPHRAAKDTIRFMYRDGIPDGLVEAIARAMIC